MANWDKVPELDKLKLIDTSAFPKPGTIVLCLMCAKPFLMPYYQGFPDQICPECVTTYRDCASLICVKCNVVVAKVQPKILASGFYVRPRAVLHIDHCNICRDPAAKALCREFEDVSYVVEVREYEKAMGAARKIIVPGRKS